MINIRYIHQHNRFKLSIYIAKNYDDIIKNRYIYADQSGNISISKVLNESRDYMTYSVERHKELKEGVERLWENDKEKEPGYQMKINEMIRFYARKYKQIGRMRFKNLENGSVKEGFSPLWHLKYRLEDKYGRKLVYIWYVIGSININNQLFHLVLSNLPEKKLKHHFLWFQEIYQSKGPIVDHLGDDVLARIQSKKTLVELILNSTQLEDIRKFKERAREIEKEQSILQK